MPYGIAKALGGDKPSTETLMDKCVQDVMATGKPKLNAILICKSSISKKLAKGKHG